MVRLPAGFHPQAARRTTDKRLWAPGVGLTGQRPITPVPVQAYTRRTGPVPLTGGQAQGTISAAGTLTLQVGPAGLGTMWYPASVTVSTTTGALDGSTCRIYLGVQGVAAQLVATLFPGGAGTAALAIPAMQDGQLIIAIWSGAHVGDTAAFNIVGTMDALTTGAGS